MTWATRQSRTMDNGSRPMDPSMLEPIEVRAVKPFGIGEVLVEAGTTITVPRHRAEYLRFLQLVEWV